MKKKEKVKLTKEEKELIKKERKQSNKEFKKLRKENKNKKLNRKEKRIIKQEKQKRKLAKKEKKENKKKLNLDFNAIIGGLFVGIANIIPGVSGGTMLVIFGLFDKLTYAVSDVFKKSTTTRKQSIIFILKVMISCLIGIVVFAKILGFTLANYEGETILCFMGLILFSVPYIYKDELKGEKFNILFFLIGFGFIIGLQYLKSQGYIANSTDSSINIVNSLILFGLGLIAGMTMVFPGVSGSMVMLVLGKYELIRSFIDKLTSFDTNSIISLCILGVGAVIGIVLSAKVTSSLLKNHRGKTVSLILGFIIASALILPFNLETDIKFTTIKTCSLLVWFTIGGMIVYYINQLKKKND